jgi:Fe2+ transport system protein FeoA
MDVDDEDGQRLKAMGVCLSRKVELVKAGDPLILRVLGSRIGLSARLARRVWVQTCDEPECRA